MASIINEAESVLRKDGPQALVERLAGSRNASKLKAVRKSLWVALMLEDSDLDTIQKHLEQ